MTIRQGAGTPTDINVLAFSGDAKFLAAGKYFGRVVVWDFAGRKSVRAIETGQGIVIAVALNSDGTILATGGNGDKFSVKLWGVSSGKLIKTIKVGLDFVTDLRFDRSGKWLSVTYNQGRAYVFDTVTLSPVLQLKDTQVIRFLENGSLLLSEGSEGFSTFSTADWSKRGTIPKWEGYPELVAVDALRDRMAVYQSSDGGVHLNRLSTGDPLDLVPQFPKQRKRPRFVKFSPDGSYLYSSIDDRLWLADTRGNGVCGSAVMYRVAGALSPDGRWVVGSKDESFSKERRDGVWVWDTEKLVAACGITPPGGNNSVPGF